MKQLSFIDQKFDLLKEKNEKKRLMIRMFTDLRRKENDNQLLGNIILSGGMI